MSEVMLPSNKLQAPEIQRRERLREVLERATGSQNQGTSTPWVHLPEMKAVSRVYLSDEGDQVHLTFQIADTLEQARAFYESDAPRNIQAFGPDWVRLCNFHWGFMAKGLAHTPTPLPVGDYLDYWIAHIGSAVSVKREAWPSHLEELAAARIIMPVEGPRAFDEAFTHTKRQFAVPRPGLSTRRVWPRAAADALDRDGDAFVGAVSNAIKTMLLALGAEAGLDGNRTNAVDTVQERVRTGTMSPRSGRRLDAASRGAVEQRGVDVAMAWLSDNRWTDLRDTGAYESWDIEGVVDGRIRYAEAKGTTGAGEVVEVTRGEVASARAHGDEHVMLIVHSITLNIDDTEKPVATGGDLRVFDPWRPTDDTLTPRRFDWVAPKQ